MTQRTGIGDAGTLRLWQPTQVDINRLRGLNADPAIEMDATSARAALTIELLFTRYLLPGAIWERMRVP